MKPKRENDNPKLANQKNKNQKSNLTFYYLIAIYLGVFQFHNMLQSHCTMNIFGSKVSHLRRKMKVFRYELLTFHKIAMALLSYNHLT